MAGNNSLNEVLGTTDVIWNLQDLYLSEKDAQLLADINWCKQEALDIKTTYYSRVASLSGKDFKCLVVRMETLDCSLSKLATFSFLNFATQMDNSEAGALDQKIRELHSECGSLTIFFELEWNSLDDTIATSLLDQDTLAQYRHYLQTLRKNRPHQLSEIEEKILLEKEIVGRRSWTTLFNKVLSSYKFGSRQRTEEEVLTDLYNPDRETRKTAAAELTEGLQTNSHILTHIFNTLAADKMVTDRLRKHSSWVSSMNLHNELHDTTVDTLVQAVTSRYDIVSRYYNLKKELLGLSSLQDYDRYAPLPALPSMQISWNSSQETVLKTFSAFSPQMAIIAKDFFDKKWIHGPIATGKRGGAFAHPCVPEVHPYVMVNYAGSLRDVSTVAHELGHGIHQVLASEVGHYNSDTPLPLAETASVFAELLVFNSQLDQLKQEDEKRAFICQKLESIFATVFRQTAMNRFEHLMHEGRREKGELSAEQLSEFWMTTQQQMFGDSVKLGKDYGCWWSYIPHFLSTPGYVYSYAFGELLVLALYGIYQKEGDSFVEKYINLLKSGGSLSPYELMEPFNIDLDSADFWHNGLDVIDKLLQRVE